MDSFLPSLDPATALVIVASCFRTPELGIEFRQKKVGLVVEYSYFLGK